MAETAKIEQGAPPISLTDALAILDRVEPVAPVERDLQAARGLTLASDAKVDTALRLAGARLRLIDIALLSSSSNIEKVSVRIPNVVVLYAAPSTVFDPTAALIADAIKAEGAAAPIIQMTE